MMIALDELKLCECECGLPAPIAMMTNRRLGHIKGQPVHFISGHNGRRSLANRFWEKVNKSGPIVRLELGPCWLWTRDLDRKGYGRISVNGRTRRASHIALELAGFIVPAEFLQVLHKCDTPRCVRASLLRIGTAQDDADDRVSKGRQARGERLGQAKPNPTKVLEIRRLYAAGGISQRALAKQFGVTQSTIKDALNGRAWRHVQ